SVVAVSTGADSGREGDPAMRHLHPVGAAVHGQLDGFVLPAFDDVKGADGIPLHYRRRGRLRAARGCRQHGYCDGECDAASDRWARHGHSPASARTVSTHRLGTTLTHTEPR